MTPTEQLAFQVLAVGNALSLLGAGLALGVAWVERRRAAVLTKALHQVREELTDVKATMLVLKGRLDHVESSAYAVQIREVLDEALARARGYREERDELRAQIARDASNGGGHD